MKCAVTVSLVPEVRGGPFVFWEDLKHAIQEARTLGYDGIEIFAPNAEFLRASNYASLIQENGLRLAALGTGAAWAKHRLSLTAPEPQLRMNALEFVREMIRAAAPFKAGVIVGSLQGRVERDRNETLEWLREALVELGIFAQENAVQLLFEPLNRYETNVFNRLDATVEFLRSLPGTPVKVLADLFHMNIEERSLPEALASAGPLLGHVHLVDSNRRPAGGGHIDFAPIFQTLRQMRYTGFLSAEALPFPDSKRAAEQTIHTFRKHHPGNPSP